MAARIDQWLEQLGLAVYGELFAANELDFDVLPDLTDDDLRGLGIPLGHRKKLLRGIAALATPPAPAAADAPAAGAGREGERRQLTVMFCDLVDSTALSSRLDPEDLRDVILAYQNAAARVIVEYGGHVAKFLGDGVLAYFGYPQAHEDDAERAARAALAIVAALAGGGSWQSGHEITAVAVRIGIDTGIVVVGDVIGEGAAREAAVVGETPNVAARLQALAQPDQIVVGPLTRELIGEAFVFEDLGACALKGLPRPVHAFVLGGEAAGGGRDAGTPRDALPLVGRDEELAILARAWDATKRGSGQAVLVRGEPGIGKSRLVAALRGLCERDGAQVVTSACSPYHASATLHPVASRLALAMDWRAGDADDVRLAKLEAHVRRHDLSPERVVPLYAELLSLALPPGRYAPVSASAEAKREQLLDALASELFAQAERAPLVSVWEDLQWADATTLQFLGLCIDQAPTVPLLIVLTFRTEFSPPWPARSHVTQVALNRLAGRDVEALVAQRTAGRNLPPQVVEYVLGKTDGVPLYVEELTKALLEADFLREENGTFVIGRPLSDAAIPATLHDLLMARLDRLPTIREVAQLGSVLGREFAYEMLSAVAKLAPATLHLGLDQLVDCELLDQRGRRPRARYVFRHALIHDAAYHSLLKRTRQTYHRQVAELLESRYPDVVRTQPELVAHHYARADDHPKAVEYLTACALKSAAMFAHANAVDVLREARAHAERLPAARRDETVLGLVLLEAESLHFTGAREEMIALLRAHEGRLDAPRSPAMVAEFHFWLGFAHSWLGHRDEASRLLTQGLAEAAAAGSERVVGRVHRALATECYYSGRPLGEAIEHARSAVAILTGTQDFWLGQALFTLCYCCTFRGDFAEALVAAHALSAFSEASGSARSRANAAMLEGLARASMGDGAAAIPWCERALAISPDRFETALILASLGKACVEAGDFERAVTVLGDAVALADQVRSHQFRAWFKTMLAEACLCSGDVARAESLAREAQQASGNVGFRMGSGLSAQVLARTALAAGDLSAARRATDEAMDALASIDAAFEVARTRLTRAALARAEGDGAAATADLREARDAFARMGCVRYVERADEALCSRGDVGATARV